MSEWCGGCATDGKIFDLDGEILGAIRSWCTASLHPYIRPRLSDILRSLWWVIEYQITLAILAFVFDDNRILGRHEVGYNLTLRTVLDELIDRRRVCFLR